MKDTTTASEGILADTEWLRSPEPGWLDSPYGPLFTWYHPPRQQRRDCAVLLCDPFGSERMNLHLAYRHLALQLSHAGFACLRVDYPGTADSAGMPRSTQRLSTWLESLGTAADHLRQRSGTTSLAAFGARLGATLAALFAATRPDVTDLVLWGPYNQGKHFLRECQALERMMASNPNGRTPDGWQQGDREAVGFLLQAAMVEDLERASLEATDQPPCTRACILPWETAQQNAGIADRWRRMGAAVDLVEEPLFSGQMSLRQQAIPWPVIEYTDTWLNAAHPPVDVPEPGLRPVLPTRATIPGRGGDLDVCEEAVFLDTAGGLFGILTRPASGAPETHQGIVLINGGTNHRVGINRNATEWARRWAARGWPVLRFDIRGLGDSPPQRPEDLNVLYRSETTSDVREAMAWLEKQLGLQEFVVGGLCAGAYQALHASIGDSRVRGLVLLELLRYYADWKQPSSRWGRALARRNQALGRSIPLPWSRVTPLARWITECCERGCRVLAVFNEPDDMQQRLLGELGPRFARIRDSGCFESAQIPDGNHIFSPVWCQQEMTRLLDGYLASLRGICGERISLDSS